jgi:hypothetical protein
MLPNQYLPATSWYRSYRKNCCRLCQVRHESKRPNQKHFVSRIRYRVCMLPNQCQKLVQPIKTIEIWISCRSQIQQDARY